ncbi:peptidase [Methanomicrobiaceae archaeon CYW5]|uniref:M1 family metallopeptidase n=1 Tax=Methanovulcanius yangii TaxID=1789227 RepID=UPI0029CA9D7E|nr:M1 family metallopeptidase [Methanovulcanius yangii]MBT8507650.1 peptidase [Methanovulcanius yangii]
MTSQRLFRYLRSDFGEIPVRVLHMDLTFDVEDETTTVRSKLHLESGDAPLASLTLNANTLEILAVSCASYPVTYEYDQGNAFLHLTFATPVPPETRFVVQTTTLCRPTANILEGLYYDATPEGAPPQQITQCQQWGFQRIVPCIDDMTAKCTYTTTIIADAAYTNLISNGDVDVERHPACRGRDSITYHNCTTPMAPYLFFLGVGTYDTFTRPLEYPDGTTFTLELLVPPGTDPALAEESLGILADSILWVYLYTGPETYEKRAIRDDLYRLCRERDELIRSGAAEEEIWALRVVLAEMVASIEPGYRYTGSVYREIGMQNSDFGGMENVGNTTITTNRILPFPQAPDGAFDYLIRVKVHEFYHNLNGSEVTGATPFELWLNEAVTVHIEQQYHAFLFGEDYSRLQTVLTLLSPDGGTFYYDRGATSIPIEPDGFNDPNDLITGVTYVKAPEVVKMIETIVGPKTFVKGLDLYHTRYRHGNATTADWLAAMEEASGVPLTAFAEPWMKKTGFPVVAVTSAYDAGSGVLTITFAKTEGSEKWTFPFAYAAVGEDGKILAEDTVLLEDEATVVRHEGIDAPAFLSLNRGYSFYGKVVHSATDEELLRQVREDDDISTRYVAFATLLDREKTRLMGDPTAPVSDHITTLLPSLLADADLMARAGGQFLTIFESVDDEAYAHRYRALYDARRTILRATAEAHTDALMAVYHTQQSKISGGKTLQAKIADIKHRQAKNTALGMLATLDTPEIHELLKRAFVEAANASDRLTAFTAIINSTSRERMHILWDYMRTAREHPVMWEGFLAAVASLATEDATTVVREVMASCAFSIEQANDQRALLGRFAQNKKVSLQTAEGRRFLFEIITTLAPVNEYSTVGILSVLGNIDRMEVEYHLPLIDLLLDVLKEVPPETAPSVHNTARRLLQGSPGARAHFERVRKRTFPHF